jgi:CheY-like chemotaxis protein
MVELMDGRNECESAVGVGTTFTVRLCIAVAHQRKEEKALEGVRVLLVDHDEVVLSTGLDTLRSLGAVADTAGTVAMARERVESRHGRHEGYDVIVIDGGLPDAVALTRAICEDLGTAAPSVLVSAYDCTDIEDAARDAGASGFIDKPLFRSSLCAKISELMGVDSTVSTSEEDNSDIAGMQILVVEDNDINWEVISMMLEMSDIHCDRAENGQQAVDMLGDPNVTRYDLVFMDIQMPVLNGLDATRAIRRLPDEWARHVPIIAMTADAFSENVTECLEAGMNGHIAKPIDMKLVLKEIREVKRRSS